MNCKKIITLVLSLTLTLSSVIPCVSYDSSIQCEAAESYAVRDPFFSFSSGYNYYESEHFQFIWGKSGDASKVTEEFLARNAENLENCWNVYMNDLKMAAPSQSVNVSLRDGKEYKTNIYISGTGLSGMEDDWAYMSYDSDGFAYMFCCTGSMQYNPPSWVLPHEFGHVVTAHQLGWNSNKYSYAWWEAMGNWYREQYLYSDYSSDTTGHGTDFFETYLKNLCFTFPCGRDYYAAWPFLQYLTENPDNMDGYGSDFVKKILQQGQVDEYPFDIVDRLAEADLKDTLGNFAKRMAGLDFKNGDSYRARLDELLSSGSWNWQQIYTMPDYAGENTYTVPAERAPQFAGMNIIPLDVTGNTVSVSLEGMTNIKGADWRACIVQQRNDGSCVYSPLFSDGDTCEAEKISDLKSAYITVIATPDSNTYTKTGLPYGEDSEFAEGKVSFTQKERYPYSLTVKGAEIKSRKVSTENNAWNPWVTYSKHPNGGGLVASSAKVDAGVYVAPDAVVAGSAVVSGNARIEDHAVVQDNARVSGNAVISGYAVIAENAEITDNAGVYDCAMVMGRAKVSGNAKVTESACVYDDFTLTDFARAKGNAFCMSNGKITGQGTADGDYYDDGGKTVSKGTAFGWVCSQSYVDALSYTDKLLYAYDFSDDSSRSFSDRYSSTYGLSFGNPLWESERTSASGVITFNGKNQYAQLDKGLLYTDDIDLQIAFLPKSASENQTLVFLGNDKNHIKITADGTAEFCLNGKKEFLKSDEKPVSGSWNVLRIVTDGDKAALILNDKESASGTVTAGPSDIAGNISLSDKSAAYRIAADNHTENCFSGSIDFLRVYSSKAESPSEKYSGSEESSESDGKPGDINSDGTVNILDLVLLKNIVVFDGSSMMRINADVNSDSVVDARDILELQKILIL